MADITQSFSQLLLTYGPGAMLDLPEHAVVVSGLQGWRYGKEWLPLEEERLIALLRRDLADKLGSNFLGLRQPPVFEKDKRDKWAPGIDVTVFPTWFIVDDDRVDGDEPAAKLEKRRRLIELRNLSRTSLGKLSYMGNGQRREVNPIRFVAACAGGHLQDIDWRFLTHRSGDNTCRKPLYWVERGVSSDPGDIAIRCTCGASISLADLYKPKFLGPCKCQSPWLPRSAEPETCDKDLKLLPRSATNTYFPQIVTVISLAKAESRVLKVVQEHRSTLESIRVIPNYLAFLRLDPRLKDAFRDFSDDEIERAIAADVPGTAAASADPRVAEFDLMASGKPTIGDAGAESSFFGETLDLDALKFEHPWRDLLRGIVKVHRLREVTCLYGFTRLEAPPTSAESEMEDLKLAVDGADLAREVEWLPALEQFGEGIFLHFSPEALAAWAAKPEVVARAEVLKFGETRDAERFKRVPKYFGIVYWALHSLSHAFMSEIALECGYPLSSLKERIYAGTKSQAGRFGILIYTSTAGGQGTLGGLSSMAEQAPALLSQAMTKLALCSNDPICAEHSPATEHDDRCLHGAACHACLLVPETSCEARNSRLDRSLLVSTVMTQSPGLAD